MRWGLVMSVFRFVNGALLVGLGASLAVSVPRLWSRGGRDTAPHDVAPAAVSPRPPTSCYERVMREHPEIGRGPYRVTATIGISGRVKMVGFLPADAKSEPLLTCLRQDVGRWSFPRRSDEYAAQVLVASPVW